MKLRVQTRRDSKGRLGHLFVKRARGKGLNLAFEYGSDGFLKIIDFEGRSRDLPSIPEVVGLVNEKFMERIGKIRRIELIDQILNISTIDTINRIDTIDAIQVIKAIEKIDDVTITDIGKVATRKAFTIGVGAASDTSIWTPAANYKVRVKLVQYHSDGAVDVGLRFGTSETPWARRKSAGSLVVPLLGCNLEGAKDEELNLRVEGAVNVEGFIIGEEIIVHGTHTVTIRPTSDYSVLWYATTHPTHEGAVDEATSDGDFSYINTTPLDIYEKDDLFGFSHSIGATAVIDFVEVFFRVRTDHAILHGRCKALVDVDGSVHAGTGQSIPSTYTLFSHKWTKNPKTASDWLLGELATLRFGVRGRSVRDPEAGTFHPVRCTQCYVTIGYSI